MRAVFDTNVVIDLLHFADATALPLLAALRQGRLEIFSDVDCLAELERVLAYPQFALGAAAQAALLATYSALLVRRDATGDATCALPRCRDRDDQKFLTLAARSRADLLVTRDRELLRLQGFRVGALHCRIVSAAGACALLDAATKNPA